MLAIKLLCDDNYWNIFVLTGVAGSILSREHSFLMDDIHGYGFISLVVTSLYAYCNI